MTSASASASGSEIVSMAGQRSVTGLTQCLLLGKLLEAKEMEYQYLLKSLPFTKQYEINWCTSTVALILFKRKMYHEGVSVSS